MRARTSQLRGLRTALALGVALTLCARGVAAQEAEGTALYREHCRTCHGAAGKPTHLALSQYSKIPVMDSAFAATRSLDSIVTILINGKGKDMKSFKAKLSPNEMHEVAEYVRSMAAAKKL
jgi:mono/diheme cytochrome c family protein